MGCTESSMGSTPEGDFDMENGKQRVAFDKESGEVVDVNEPRELPEGGLFDEVDAGQGEQFMAVKPWIGAVKEPLNHPPPNPSPPDCNFTLQWVYGYRCEDSRQNVYLNPNGEAVYMTAALGVILDDRTKTQKYFGGGQVAMKAKNISDDTLCHTDDITALRISSDRRSVVSGQVGSSPAAFMWDSVTGEKQGRYKLPKGSRGIDAIALSKDGKFVALVDRHDDHNVYVFEAQSGQLVGKAKGDTNRAFDMAFSERDGDYSFVTAGAKHIKFWQAELLDGKRGIFGSNESTSFACVAMDNQGVAYAGGANGLIYVWNGNNCSKTLNFHKGGFVGAIRYSEGKVYSGGKDGNLCIFDSASHQLEKTISFDGILIRAVDVFNGQAVVGLRSGSIYQVTLATEQKFRIMSSHSDGEVWGLSVPTDDLVLTVGDDNQIMGWSPQKKDQIASGTISTVAKALKRRGASSLTSFPDSQCARAISYNPSNGHVAIGHNDGTLTIRASINQLDQVIFTTNDSKEWIEAIQYSPCGTMLAVGSHDNNIYIYGSDSYNLIGVCKKHNSFIVCLDWSLDSSYIRSCCGAHELLFFTIPSCNQDPSGPSNTVGTEWATGSSKFGWLVDGVFPTGTDGTHVNNVCFSKDQTLIVTADDYGLVNIFRNPCRKGHTPVSLRGHSEHVVRIAFNSNDTHLFSIGGYDQTLMQWLRN